MKKNIENNEDIRLLKAFNGNTKIVIQYLESLLNTSKRQYALILLGKIEAYLGNIDLSKTYFYDALFDIAIDEKKDKQQSLKNNKIKSDIYNLLILCYIEEEDDLSTLRILKQMIINKLQIDYKVLEYMYNKLNITLDDLTAIFKLDYNKTENIIQKLTYNKEKALQHIINEHVKMNNQLKSKFSSLIDINKLFETVSKKLISSNKSSKLSLNDSYIIFHLSAGTNGQNFIKVVTRPKSMDIVTMYPVYSDFETNLNSKKH